MYFDGLRPNKIMAQCKLTPREFIGNTFSPQIAVVCSAVADAACQKNNLSFVELLQPFCKLNTEGKPNFLSAFRFLRQRTLGYRCHRCNALITYINIAESLFSDVSVNVSLC